MIALRGFGSAFCLVLAGLAGCSDDAPDPARGRTGLKVVLVGIDGADPNVMKPLLDRGDLPNLKRLLEQGGSGVLKAPVAQGITSPALWTMAVTGKPPEEHGITDFVLPMPDAPHVKVPAASGHRTAPALWNLLSDAGLRSVVVGLWATWPAEAIRGAIVSDHTAYSRMKASTTYRVAGSDGDVEIVDFDYDTTSRNMYPSFLGTEIEPLLRLPEQIEPELLRRFADLRDDEIERIRATEYGGNFNIQADPFQELKFTVQADRSYAAVGLHLARHPEFDPAFLLVYLEGIDVIEHAFWAHRAGLDTVPEEDRARFAGVVDRYYAFTDALIGDYLAMASPDTVVLVHSDHGYKTEAGTPAGHWHSEFGVLLGAGGPIRPGAVLATPADLLDVAPNVLYLLGLPVADDMKGRIWSEWYDDAFEDAHPVQTVATFGARSLRPEDVMESDIDELHTDRMKGLGYLGGGGSRRRSGRDAAPRTTDTQDVDSERRDG